MAPIERSSDDFGVGTAVRIKRPHGRRAVHFIIAEGQTRSGSPAWRLRSVNAKVGWSFLVAKAVIGELYERVSNG